MKHGVILLCMCALWLCEASQAMAAGDPQTGEPSYGVSNALHLGAWVAGFQYGSHTLERYSLKTDVTSTGTAVGSGGALQLGYVLDIGLELGVVADIAYAYASMPGKENWAFSSSGLALVQYYFLPRDIFSPYVGLGLGGFYSDGTETAMYGFRLGTMAGLVYLVGSAAALDLRGVFSYDVGDADTSQGAFDVQGWTLGVQIGISLYL